MWETRIREERLFYGKDKPTNLWIESPRERREMLPVVGCRMSDFVMADILYLKHGGVVDPRRRLTLGLVARGRSRSLLRLGAEFLHTDRTPRAYPV